MMFTILSFGKTESGTFSLSPPQENRKKNKAAGINFFIACANVIFMQRQKLKYFCEVNFFENKVVWITGASSGIGEALVHQFAKENAKIILSSRNEKELQRVVDSAKI